MLPTIELGEREISPANKPYVIAEIGVNHEGSFEQAKRLIEQAKAGGADAAKFQSYKAGSLASKNSPSYWDTKQEKTRSQYELFKKYDNFGSKEYIALAEHCQLLEIDFVSTPFDDDAIEFLDPLVSYFKIASADITNIPFLRKVASKEKPVLLSTGASTLGEVEIALETMENFGCHDIVLLHCILNYPTPNENAHLRMIEGLRRAYPNRVIGYSDHTLPDDWMTSLVTAWLLGAMVLEKHFTHDKTLPGNDHYHAMDQRDLSRFCEISERIQIMLGSTTHKKPISSESISRLNARRSIVITNDVDEGHILNQNDLTCKRPGTGISPHHWDEVLGQCTTTALEADHLLQWKDLKYKEESQDN